MKHYDSLKNRKFYIFIAPRKEIGFHSHDFLELAYVLKGEAEHFCNDTSMKINEGDYFVIDYNSSHSYKAKTDEFELINCLFLPELIDSSLINCRSLQTVISNYQIHFKNDFLLANPSTSIFKDENNKIKDLLFSIMEEFNTEAPGYLQIIRSKLIEILVFTMRKIYLVPKIDTNQNNDMEKILKYINSEYMNDISLKEISKKFNYSFSHLSMKFKKVFGITYKEYLQKIRIEQSMRLLAHSDFSIEEISQSVGYKDIKAFYQVFKKIANTTPASFRKK